MKRMQLLHGLGKTEVILHAGFPFESWINEQYPGLKIAITDDTIYSLFLKQFPWLWNCFDVVIQIPTGEPGKQFSVYIQLIESLVEKKADRTTTLFAVGGGVVGDLTGFVAGTFMRGIPYVQIPTTLLSQIDSSIGGKTGINLESGKNLVGVFYQPTHIIIDPDFLTTLPDREVISALGEVFKYFILDNETEFQQLKNYLVNYIPSELLSDHRKQLIEWMEICIQIKLKIVEKDERESDSRALLNFGHTTGHAIEKYYGYEELRHGEAVTIGCWFASYFSWKTGQFSEINYQHVKSVATYLLPASPQKRWDSEKINSFLQKDKKKTGSGVTFILPIQIGKCERILLDSFDLVEEYLSQFQKEELQWPS